MNWALAVAARAIAGAKAQANFCLGARRLVLNFDRFFMSGFMLVDASDVEILDFLIQYDRHDPRRFKKSKVTCAQQFPF